MTQVELLITLETKYYIFSARRLNNTLSTIAFKYRMKHTLLSLQEIATQNGKLDTFNKQWHLYKCLIIE